MLYRFVLFIVFSILFSIVANAHTPKKEITIPFYTEDITLHYAEEIIINTSLQLEERSIVYFYELLNSTPYQSVVNTIKKNRNQFNLNDWLSYVLVKKIVNEIYKDKSKTYKVLATWFFMSKLDYDTRLAYVKREAFLYVKTNDNIYETPMIEDDDGKRFLGLTELQYKKTHRNKSIYLLNFLAAPGGNGFSLKVNPLPTLKPNLENKDFHFNWRNQKYVVDVQLDKNVVDIMSQYPIIDESEYIIAPFSKYLENSLLTQLKQIIDARPILHQIEILAAFTRSAFHYKEDESYFGRSKPMIREEVFHYPYSDCEDRSAVFYGLVKELLDLPMLVIAFPDHLTIAVALDEPIGPAIQYKGKEYYICDPTGPNNSIEIGRIPNGYENQSFEILYASTL